MSVKLIHKNILKHPREYEDRVPKSYGFLLTYVSSIICRIIHRIAHTNANLRDAFPIIVYLSQKALKYPEIVLGYHFDRKCVESLLIAVRAQDEINRRHLMALLIGILARIIIIKNKYLNDNDKSTAEKHIRELSIELHEAMSPFDFYIQVHPSGEIKLMINGASASISGILQNYRDISLDSNEIINELRKLGFEIRQ